MQKIQSFFSHYVSFENRVILLLVALTFFLSAFFIGLNHWFFHYTHIMLFTTAFSTLNLSLDILLTILCLCMFFVGLYTKASSPRGATFIWGFSALFLAFYAHIALTNAIQTTPFPPIDAHLAQFDAWIGVDTPALMTWTHQYPHVLRLLNGVYAALLIELVFIPFGLACFNARRTLSIFLIAELSTFITGSLIYYFFPTMAPSGIFHSPYFSLSQQHTSLRFYDVHHFIPFNFADGGLIAFPSFHVVWSILLTYCTLNQKWIFYPLCVFNAILILSTVLLGWHYAADVIAGFLLAFLGIYVGKRCWE